MAEVVSPGARARLEENDKTTTAATATEAAAATAPAASEVDEEDATHTHGKHDFNDLYNAPDASNYMVTMAALGYVIGDNTARVTVRAIASLFKDIAVQPAELQPVVLELCAGYGLSMASVRTMLTSPQVAALYKHEARPKDPAEARVYDKKFFDGVDRPVLPPVQFVGADVANNALAYGKAVGLYDATVCQNLEIADGPNPLTAEDRAIVSRAKIVMATGAFSYITPLTLQRMFDCWNVEEDKSQCPVFLFFPLVATDVSKMIETLTTRGLEVFYEPALHWLPQRVFADPREASVMLGKETVTLAGKERPIGARDGHIHATPLIAGPPGVAARAREWVLGAEAAAVAALKAAAEAAAAEAIPAAAGDETGAAIPAAAAATTGDAAAE